VIAAPGRPRAGRIALLLLLLAIAAVAGSRAVRRAQRFAAAEASCAAAERGDWQQALAAGVAPSDTSVAGLRASECRCVALVATRRAPECVALLEDLLADAGIGDWLPRPELLAGLVEHRRQRGDVAGAARLAGAGADRYPTSETLLLAEAGLRLQLEGLEALDRLTLRLEKAGPAAPALRLTLAHGAAAHEDWERTALLLGETPPSGPRRPEWYVLRMQAMAGAGRAEELLAAAEEWAAIARPELPRAYYAYLLTTNHLDDPRRRSALALLLAAIHDGDKLGEPDILRLLYVRLVAGLTVIGQEQAALRAFDEGVARVGHLNHLDRDDLLRSALATPQTSLSERAGKIELRVADPRPGDRLLVSPDADLPRDAAYEPIASSPAGPALLTRRPDVWPVRWVLVQADGRVVGSGTTWPRAGQTTRVVARRRPPKVPAPAAPPALPGAKPPRGRPRLFLVMLDCGDWRFVQYGRARRELPVLEALLAGGHRAVLDSDPPYTSVAVRSIVKPGGRHTGGVLGVLHALGGEAAGLNFIGRNPAEPIGWLLPTGVDLFTTLGGGSLRTVNLLHSHGGMEGGRHGETVGPFGARARLPIAEPRELLPGERALFPAPPTDDNLPLILEMATDFDVVIELARRGEADLVVMRVASFDLLTHSLLPGTAAAGQDDGVPALFGVYRLADRRLGELLAQLDGNDVLAVMSDHGARTALQHDRQALFVAAGAGIRPGRSEGRPALAGVPRWIAEHFGVATPWPATGVAPSASSRAAHGE
jgi:hypothetical protein